MKQGNKIRTIALLSSASILIGIGSAYAATQTVTAHIKFVTDITVTENKYPDFGDVVAGVADTYTLSTAGAVTAAGSGKWEGGTSQAGNYTITASAGTPMEMYVGTYTAGTNGTTAANAICNYNAAGDAACGTSGSPDLIASPVASATLLIGLDATTLATSTDGQTDNPSFDLHVVYQ